MTISLGGRALALVHVLANRGHTRAARTLAQILTGGTRGLTAARAAVLRETLDLGHRGLPRTSTVAGGGWAAALGALLSELDNGLAASGGAASAPDLVGATVEALTLAFHPRLQQGRRTSPLVADPQGFGALLEGHAVLDLLRARTTPQGTGTDTDIDTDAVRGPSRPAEVTTDGVPGRSHAHSRTPTADAPLRLLVLTDTNLTFMPGLLRHWEAREDVDLRVRDLRAEGADARWWSLRATVGDRLTGTVPAAPQSLGDDLRRAEVVWVEWGGALAARLSAADLPDTRVIVRLHRYEAFTMYPQVTHWEGVDDLVVVSGAIGRLLESSVPDIGGRTRVHVIGNVVDLHRNVLPKRPAAARTLALIGWDRPMKDPDWALDVLECLLAQDPSWRLLLVGAAPTGGDGAAERTWVQALTMRVAGFGDSVVSLGQRGDVPEVLRDVSVVLSSSLVESAHLALQEGVASGCLPVVRDWPGIAAFGGPSDIYPRDWVVTTPEQAARRILEAAHAPEVGRFGPADSTWARTASRWVLEHLDASTTLPLVDDLIGGGGS